MVISALAVATTVRSSDANADAGLAPDTSTDYAMVELVDKPLATYDGGIPGLEATKPTGEGKVDLASPAAHAYGLYLKAKHDAYRGYLGRNAPGAEVVKEYSLLFNGFSVKLNSNRLEALAHSPHVKSVAYETIYHPDMNVSPGLINAPELWGVLGGNANAGAGIKIGIIDTGVDPRHPFLTDASLPMPAGFPRGDTRYTSNKVIVARVFATPSQFFTARPVQDHGSHVAGTAAGVYGTTATFKNVTITGLSGVAPKAYLGSYVVFPDHVTNAFAHDIVDALEVAYADGMDVVNMSLGGTPGKSPVPGGRTEDQLELAVDAASAAGMVVAVAAGNAGPGPGTVESPGAAPGALTAGATTNPHFVGIPVSVTGPGTPSASLQNMGAAVGDFAVFNKTTTVTYNYIFDAKNARGCNAITQDLKGKIALISRGTCTFTTKVRNAQTAGAMGVIVYNNVAGDPVAMAQDGTTPVPTIPAVMVTRTQGLAMKAFNQSNADPQLFISPIFREFLTSNADILAGFSSRGPTFGTLLIKPDVTAPGVNVLSSIVCTQDDSGKVKECPYAFFQGTSMATPHVAGSAALLKQLHPGWTPEQIKSALVTTGNLGVRNSFTGSVGTRVTESGGGRIDLGVASKVDTTVAPASFSFRFVPTNDPFTRSETFTVKADQGATLTVSAAFTFGAPGLTASVDKAGLTVGKDGTATFTLTVAGGANTKPGDYEGWVMLQGTEGDQDTISLHVPFWIRTDTATGVNNALFSLAGGTLGDGALLAGTAVVALVALARLPMGRVSRRVA